MIRPNYEHCAKMDYWGFNTAALLLSDLCPITHRSVRVLERDIPAEFERAREICYLLKSISWETIYNDYYVKGRGIHPAAVIAVAQSKQIHIPSALLKNIELMYADELAEIRANLNRKGKKTNKSESTDLGSRERKSWQLGLGLMIRLYAKKIGKLNQHGEVEMSSSQLQQLLLDEADKIGISLDGLKSFDRKITQTLELISDESNL